MFQVTNVEHCDEHEFVSFFSDENEKKKTKINTKNIKRNGNK